MRIPARLLTSRQFVIIALACACSFLPKEAQVVTMAETGVEAVRTAIAARTEPSSLRTATVYEAATFAGADKPLALVGPVQLPATEESRYLRARFACDGIMEVCRLMPRANGTFEHPGNERERKRFCVTAAPDPNNCTPPAS
ncbi:MAG TPA: hypothetical protein VHO23_00340 [Candidatus Paceibacterota bacterium]|nr:hypothetical protein [Candidatus Paceibacterota bacterium]